MQINFKQCVINVLQDESAQDLVEYAFLAVVMGLGAVVAMNSISSGVGQIFTAIESKFTVPA